MTRKRRRAPEPPSEEVAESSIQQVEEILAQLPPPIPESTDSARIITMPRMHAVSDPQHHQIDRMDFVHRIQAARDAYSSDSAEVAALVPAIRRELSTVFDAAGAQEWFDVCRDILALDRKLRDERISDLFHVAHRSGRISLCEELLRFEGWHSGGHEYDGLAHRFALEGKIELVGLLAEKGAISPSYMSHLQAQLKLGIAIGAAVEALTMLMPRRFRSFAQLAVGSEARIGVVLQGHGKPGILRRVWMFFFG
jgi:hypothetical protein